MLFLIYKFDNCWYRYISMYLSCIIFELFYCYFLDRYDYQLDDDYIDIIIGLISCQRMKLYVFLSFDGTIRIWDEINNLIR